MAFEPKRICLLTPGHLSTNPRLVKEADTLAGWGFNVTVIAADFVPWARAADQTFSSRRWQPVYILPFGPHAPKRYHVIQIVRQRLARTMVVAGMRHRAVIRAAWHPLAPDLVKAALKVRADLYIAHYPAALPAAAIAAQRYEALYAFDAEDFHLGDTPESIAYEFQRRLLHDIETHYLPGCAYMTVASPGMASVYADTYGIARPKVVLNVFPRSHAPSCPTPKGSACPGPSVYWFSQTIGPERGLECAVRAIGLAQTRPHLYLRGTPAAGFIERLRKIAAEVRAEDRLHTLPPAEPGEMARLASIYDVGFSGEPGSTPNNRIALGNKLFSYLLGGIPMVISDVPAHRALVPSLGDAARLYPIDDPAGLAAEIDALLGQSASLAKARSTAWLLGQQRFNWDVELTEFMDCVNGSLGLPPNCSREAHTAFSLADLQRSLRPAC